MGIFRDGAALRAESGFDGSSKNEIGLGLGARQPILPVSDDADIDDSDIGGGYIDDATFQRIYEEEKERAAANVGRPVREPLGVRLSRIIGAIDELLPELAHQSAQIEKRIALDGDESEMKHLRDLMHGYDSSARYLTILRRYQKGRLSRIR